MTRSILIALFRTDLRLHDHPILSQCTTTSESLKSVTHVLPLYVFDQQHVEIGGLPGVQKGKGPGYHGARTRVAGFWRTGAFRTKYLAQSVYDLKERLNSIGSDLSVWAGQPHVVISHIVKALQGQGDHVHGVWMGEEPHTEELNTKQKIIKALSNFQVPVKIFEHKSLLHPDDLPFLMKDLPDVFTSFRKRVEAPDMFREPLPTPDKLKPIPTLQHVEEGPGVKQLLQSEQDVLKGLLLPLEEETPIQLPTPDLQGENISAFPFQGGEGESLERLSHYFSGGKNAPAALYKETRNGLLGTDYSTKFSAALAHGTLSPRLIAKHASEIDKSNGVVGERGGGYWILFELLWRDYFLFVSAKYGSSMYTLSGIQGELGSGTGHEKQNDWNVPKSFHDKSDAFVRWATYQTGVPLIDANMKELALTGFMSNRGRQNVASLLTKDLYYDWRLGAEWFESLLVDYDPSSNYGNWQYVAGVGNDPRASRQFNPIKQGKDYDRDAKYIKTWLPALKSLPANEAHHPWTLQANDITEQLSIHYPSKPVIENPSWKIHYTQNSSRRGGKRGGGPRRRGGNSKRGSTHGNSHGQKAKDS